MITSDTAKITLTSPATPTLLACAQGQSARITGVAVINSAGSPAEVQLTLYDSSAGATRKPLPPVPAIPSDGLPHDLLALSFAAFDSLPPRLPTLRLGPLCALRASADQDVTLFVSYDLMETPNHSLTRVALSGSNVDVIGAGDGETVQIEQLWLANAAGAAADVTVAIYDDDAAATLGLHGTLSGLASGSGDGAFHDLLAPLAARYTPPAPLGEALKLGPGKSLRLSTTQAVTLWLATTRAGG